MKIILLYDFSKKCTTGNYVRKVLEEEHQIFVFKKLTERDAFLIKPDFILAIDDGRHYILDINYHPKAIWLIDTHLSYFCDEIMAKSFDIIFVAQKNDVLKLSQKFPFVYWLPLAFDPEWHGKKFLEKIYDLAFIGQLGTGTRKRILKEILAKYPNSYIGSADCEKIGEIYSQAKIVINYSAKNDINMRIFEGLGSGSLVLTNRIIDNGFEDLFKEDQNIVTYDNLSTLFSKIDFYLKNEQKREEIAQKGYELAIKFHTYKNRLKFILEKFKELRKEEFKNYSPFEYLLMKIELLIKVFVFRLRNQFIKFFDLNL